MLQAAAAIGGRKLAADNAEGQHRASRRLTGFFKKIKMMNTLSRVKSSIMERVQGLKKLNALAKKQLAGKAPGVALDLGKGKVILRRKIFFKSGTAIIEKKSLDYVEEIAFVLRTVADVLEKKGRSLGLEQIKYVVNGHTHAAAGKDPLAPRAVGTSYHRANSVMKHLVASGVDATNLFSHGFGGSQSLGKTPHDNRRVEICVVSPARAVALVAAAKQRCAKDARKERLKPKDRIAEEMQRVRKKEAAATHKVETHNKASKRLTGFFKKIKMMNTFSKVKNAVIERVQKLKELDSLAKKVLADRAPGVVLNLGKGKVILEQKVTFKAGTAIIEETSLAYVDTIAFVLQTVAEVLAKEGRSLGLEQIKYVINGHTHAMAGKDPFAPRAVATSFDRATSVKEQLVASGVDSSTLFSHGFGGSRPLGKTPHDDRRVEILVVSPAIAAHLEAADLERRRKK